MSYMRYRLELRDSKGLTTHPWKGKPTRERLGQWLDDYMKSFELGGENHYIVKARGYKPLILSARIVTEQTGKLVAEWTGNQVHIAPTRVPPSPMP
jgi:hypothetical protein